MLEPVCFGSLTPVQQSPRGAVAQLGERLNGIQKVDGSIPFSSILEKGPPPEGPFLVFGCTNRVKATVSEPKVSSTRSEAESVDPVQLHEKSGTCKTPVSVRIPWERKISRFISRGIYFFPSTTFSILRAFFAFSTWHT